MKKTVLCISLAIVIACPIIAYSEGGKHTLLQHEQQREEYVVSTLKQVFTGNRIFGKSLAVDAGDVNQRPSVTMLLKEARANLDGYNDENKAYVQMLLKRPNDTTYTWPWDFQPLFYLPGTVETYTTEGSKFKFWYVTHSDADGGGNIHTADVSFVEAMALVFDEVYAQVATMGYPDPPDDLGESDNGGDDKMDIYLMNCGSESIYGYTVAEGSGSTAPSFMVMDNDFEEFASGSQTPLEAMKVTAAHEYFHTIQFGINVYGSGWLMEATAAWMEDQVYDDIDDNLQYLNGLDGFFNNPHVYLNTDSTTYWYNSWIWFEYMETKWGQSAVKSVWKDYMALTSIGMSAVSSVLVDNGSTVQNAFTEFATWNYVQTAIGETPLYNDAESYNAVKISNLLTQVGYDLDYSATMSDVFATQSVGINHLASKYFKLTPGSSISDGQSDTLTLYINGTNSRDIDVIPIVKSGTDYTVQSITLDSNNDGTYELVNFNQTAVTELVLVLVNYSLSQNESVFKISGGLGDDGVANVIDTTIDTGLNPTSSDSDDDSGIGCFIMSITR